MADEFEDGPYGAGTLLYRVPDPERFGVAELDADGRVVGFEEKPEQPKSDLIPIGVYFLRPRRVRRHRPPAAVRPRRARDHRRAQPLHPRAAACSARSTTATGPTPGRSRRCSAPPSWPPPTTPPATRAAGQPAGRLTMASEPRRLAGCSSPAAPGSSARATSATSSPAATAPAITVLDKLTYAGNEANLAPVRDDPELAAPVPLRPGRHRRPGRRRAARRRRRRGRQLRRRVARRPLHPRPGGVPPDRRHRRPRPARGVSRGRDRPAALPAGLDRRGLRLRRRGPRRPRTRRSRRARRTRRPRRPASCSSGATSSPTASTPSSPAARTRTGPYHHPEKLIPLFVTNALDDQPLPLYGDGLQRRDWLYVADHAARRRLRPAPRRRRRDLQRRGRRPSGPTARSSALLLERLGKPWSLVRHVEDRPGPRPALRDGRLEAGGARLATGDDVRGRPGRHRRLVPRQRGVVAGGPVRRLGRLVRAPVRPPAGDGRDGRGRRGRSG